MLSNSVDRISVEKMVRTFYEKLVQDEIIGPYFINKLGSDLKNDKWYDHFRRLVDFWLFIMEGQEGYKGDPIGPHFFIGEFYTQTVERWLKIFDEHIHEHFTEEVAQKFNKKAKILAERLIVNLEIEDMPKE